MVGEHFNDDKILSSFIKTEIGRLSKDQKVAHI